MPSRALIAVVLMVGCAHPPAPVTIAPLPPPKPLPTASPDRARSLVETMDRARLVGDAEARAQLERDLGLPPGGARGESGTRTVLLAIADEAERAGLHELAALLDQDRAELDGDSDPLAIATARRNAQRSSDPAVGLHAGLALYASCARALFDAASAPASQRAVIADHCIYSLFDVDPSAYFDGDAASRPPDPPWAELWRRLTRLLEYSIIYDVPPSSVGSTLARVGTWQRELEKRVELEGIEPPDMSRLPQRLLRGRADLPAWDREAALIVEGDLVTIGPARYTLRDHALVERVERLVGGDPVRRLALFVVDGTDAPATAEPVDELADLARRNHVGTIDLGLAVPDAPHVPPGDPWAAADLVRPPLRVVLLSLELPGGRTRDRPRAVLETGPPALVLIVRPEGLQLRAPDGDVTFLRQDTAARLDDLRHAFPDAAQLALAIDPNARYRDLVDAALAAQARFRRLVLVPVPKPPRDDLFAERLRRRSHAIVQLLDKAGKPLDNTSSEWLRGCYLDALDDATPFEGVIKLPLPDGIVAGSLTLDLAGHATLAACIAARLRSLGATAATSLRLAPR